MPRDGSLRGPGMPVACQVCGSWRLRVWEPLRLEGFGEPWSA